MKKVIHYSVLGIAISLISFFILGIPTAVIPNRFFTRMLPLVTLDYFILIVTSLLIGSYISVSLYHRKYKNDSKDLAFTGAAIPAVLGFSCPICNALLVALFGTTTLMIYFEPIRHYVGVAGIVILSVLLYFKVQQVTCCNGVACKKRKR